MSDTSDAKESESAVPRSLYEVLGGEPALRLLVDRFYHHISTRPEAAIVRQMHPEDLSTSGEKLFYFLSGWSGGPALFHEKIGHPMLRARHLPFAIGKSERDQWMMCMVLAVEDLATERQFDDHVKATLIEALLRVADHMRNRQERTS